MARPLDDPQLPPGARQTVEELLGRIRDFLREPVRPRRIVAPVRYLELSRPHVRLGSDGAVQEVRPRPEWLSYRIDWGLHPYGISVFRNPFWLWRNDGAITERNTAVAVRRGADDKEVAAALADEAAMSFLGRSAEYFRTLINDDEEVRRRGYDDAVRKVKLVLAAAELLASGRREEGVPA